MGKILQSILEVLASSSKKAKDNKFVSSITLISAIIGLAWMVDERYALAANLAKTDATVQQNIQQTTNVVEFLKMQAVTRKTILETKKARQKLTPEEQVELDNLPGMIKALDKTNKPND